MVEPEVRPGWGYAIIRMSAARFRRYVSPNTDTHMRITPEGQGKGFFEEMRDWWREASRAYCERVVKRSLAAAPLGGHDWFLEVERVTR